MPAGASTCARHTCCFDTWLSTSFVDKLRSLIHTQLYFVQWRHTTLTANLPSSPTRQLVKSIFTEVFFLNEINKRMAINVFRLIIHFHFSFIDKQQRAIRTLTGYTQRYTAIRRDIQTTYNYRNTQLQRTLKTNYVMTVRMLIKIYVKLSLHNYVGFYTLCQSAVHH